MMKNGIIMTKLKVALNLKPKEHIITYNPAPNDRDYDVTKGGTFELAREVVERLTPAEEKVKEYLEELDKEGIIDLSIHKIPTKGLKTLFHRSKKPSVELHVKEDDSKILIIDENTDKKRLYGFLDID